jgi:hypothetical protein
LPNGDDAHLFAFEIRHPRHGPEDDCAVEHKVDVELAAAAHFLAGAAGARGGISALLPRATLFSTPCWFLIAAQSGAEASDLITNRLASPGR